jgi:hypothetical protein
MGFIPAIMVGAIELWPIADIPDPLILPIVGMSTSNSPANIASHSIIDWKDCARMLEF